MTGTMTKTPAKFEGATIITKTWGLWDARGDACSSGNSAQAPVSSRSQQGIFVPLHKKSQPLCTTPRSAEPMKPAIPVRG